jgi:hypothetical protein
MIDRRSVLQLFGGLTLGAAGWPAVGATGLDLSNRDDFLTAVIKLRGSTDDRLCIGWVTGTRYAVVNHKATPIHDMLAATFSRYRRIRPDAYSATSIEVAFFRDSTTGKLLETWTNPFTKKTVEVPQVRMGPAELVVTADGLSVDRPVGEAAGMEIVHRFKPAVTNGDHVWITEEISVEGSSPGADAKPFVYNEMSTYHARKSDLDNPDLATVPTAVDFHGLVTWRPWMGFGDMPGHTTARGSGRRAERIEDLPKYYLELCERYHPDVLNDPLAVLDSVES